MVTSKKKAEAAEPDLPEAFESAMVELEAIVAKMERGDMSLEESLAAYQRGVNLTRVCQERLASAEQKVQVLSGELLKPLATGGDNSGDPSAS